MDYTLPRKSSLSSDSNKTFCMLGHCAPSCEELSKQGGRWSMGTVLLFNGRSLIYSNYLSINTHTLHAYVLIIYLMYPSSVLLTGDTLTFFLFNTLYTYVVCVRSHFKSVSNLVAVKGRSWCDVWRAVDSQHSLGRLTEYFSCCL